MNKSVIQLIVGYFLKGLLYTLPLAVTVYIIWQTFSWIDGLIPSDIPGVGLLVFLSFVTLMGVLGSSFVARPFIKYINRLIDRVPLVKTIYFALRDLMSAFVGDKKRFDQPVLVTLNKDSEVQRLGFVTREDLSDIGIGPDRVAVYFPHSYQVSGNVFIVPKAQVERIEAKSADIMKFIVSGGVTDLKRGDEMNTTTEQ